MNKKNKLVLVTGATGNQGGAVTQALLERKMRVRALVRNLESEKAKSLAAQGVELVQGDLSHQASIERAAKGVDAAFVLTTPFAPGVGISGEIAQGHLIIDALKNASVPHVVYSSVSDADSSTGVPHFESKADSERYLLASGLPATITAPVFFNENLLFPWNLEDMKNGLLRQALPGGRKLQVVSLRDIGRFNAAVIERGPELAGRRINYAGDELSPEEMTEILGKSAGKDLSFREQPIAEVAAMAEDMAQMYTWFDEVGYTADVAALRDEFPDVGWMTFADWSAEQDWQQLLS